MAKDKDRDLEISKNRHCHAVQQCAGVDALTALKNATTVERYRSTRMAVRMERGGIPAKMLFPPPPLSRFLPLLALGRVWPW